MSQDSVQPAEARSGFPLEGGCACGNIRYALKAAPLVVHCCHCTSCQRESGTAFAVNAVVESEEVELLPGRTTTLQPLVTFPGAILDDQTPRRSRPSGPSGPSECSGPSSASRPSGPSRPGSADGTGSADGLTRDARDAPIASPILLPVPAESGAPQTIARCPVCLTAVWSNYAGLHLLKFLRVGTLDSPALLGGPDVYIFLRSKLPYVEIPDDGKPRFEEFYPQKEGVWRPEALVRREELGVRIKAWRKEKGLDA
ncbi:glutathione-dependent formaldehyde-activating [Colletotrichum karsti]|uniref:Glutathione-dependent formaldehyde-activating n=1 Tax=Colletotrichum karsti TaxID=1095194 RepID=A0A9P6I7G5_9PEZI|nr:glutathione-dependent formaldehyde-activating [Colletotrichum karsti]KAF9876506.1 glutathione-dependent formaldehyde-activating [Colletotrichum karsti]